MSTNGSESSDSPLHDTHGGWDSMFLHEEFRWKQPLPCVMDFIRDLRREGKQQVCDLGCGAGRHTILLCREGFNVIALDHSPHGLAHTRHWLKEERLNATVISCRLPKIPLDSESVDAVVTTNVIHHDRLANVKATVREIQRILKDTGLVLLTVLSKDDYRYGTGNQIEYDTFIDCDGPEKGILHHFFDKEGLRQLFIQFEEVRPPIHVKSLYKYVDNEGQEYVGDLLLGIFRKAKHER